MEDHLPPRPSKQSMEETLQESYDFEQSQKGAPPWARHRYFLVNYGIEYWVLSNATRLAH